MNLYGLYIKATYNYACILLNLVSSLRVFPAIQYMLIFYLSVSLTSAISNNIYSAHPIAIFLSYIRLRNSPAFSYSNINSLPIDRYHNLPIKQSLTKSIFYYKFNGRYLGSHHVPNNTFFLGFPHTLRLPFPVPLWCIVFSIFPAY